MTALGDFVDGNVLDAAELNVVAAETSFTPVWTGLSVGNGTATGIYYQVQNVVFLVVTLEVGSTTTVTGPVFVDFPSGLDAQELLRDGSTGQVFFEDADGTDYYGYTFGSSGTRFQIVAADASSTYLKPSSLSSTVPFTWATGDKLVVSMVYKKYEPPTITGNFLDEFDDNDTTPWIVTVTGNASVTESVADAEWGAKLGIKVIANGQGGNEGTATANYPYELAYHDYFFEFIGTVSRSNFGSIFGSSSAEIWFRGSDRLNCLRFVTATSSYDGLFFQKLVAGAVVESVQIHSHTHKNSTLDGERMRVHCVSGSCQVQEWNGSAWVDVGTPISDDGSTGEYFGLRARGNYSLGGQSAQVALDYIDIQKI